MKRLMLMRHAEAQAPEAGQGDRQRPLTRKGQADMDRLHAFLQAENLMPQVAVASDSTRTKATLLKATGNGFAGNVEFRAALYNAASYQIIETARSLDDRFESALIVAHNPGIHQAVLDLADEACLAGFQPELGLSYKAGTLAVLMCAVDSWHDLAPGKNKLVKLFVPDESF